MLILVTFSGDITQRMCTAAEIEAYARSFSKGESTRTKSNYLKPNINCNLSSWLNGCEPGWACKANQKVELNNNKKEIPVRSVDCQPCCEGFFCPHGITCMIRKYLCLYKSHYKTRFVPFFISVMLFGLKKWNNNRQLINHIHVQNRG